MEHRSHHNSPRSSFATQIFSGTGVNHTTTVIIVVLCVVAGMLIFFGLFRFLRHRLARHSTPLPPVQPIAHYRKQRLTEFTERPTMSSTYSLSSRLSPSIGLSPAASDSSFLPAKYDQTSPSQSSLYLADNSDVQGVPPPPSSDEEVLPTPNPAFNYARRFSSSSLGSASSTPLSISVASRSPSQTTLSRSYSRRTGPATAASSTSIRSTRSSRSTIIGVPHGPLSQVKLVLPAPLAPSLHPYMSGQEAGRFGVDDQTPMRTTMVDMWASPLHRSVSSDHIRPKSPAISATHRHGASPSKPRQRASCHTLPSSYYSSAIGSPPVPPIPIQYRQLNGAPYATQHEQDDPTRGRPLMLSQPSSEGSYTTHHEDREESPRESSTASRTSNR